MSAVATEKSFAELAKKYKARDNHVLAIKHTGEPKQYPTEHGTETAYEGDYVVQVGEVEHTETIPPKVEGEKRIPGSVKTHKVPKLEVVKGEDFERLYEAK